MYKKQAFLWATGLCWLLFASSAATVLEYSLGGNPLLRELPVERFSAEGGRIEAPTAPGLGVTPRPDFIADHTRTAD